VPTFCAGQDTRKPLTSTFTSEVVHMCPSTAELGLRRRAPAERVKAAEAVCATAADRHAIAARDAAPHAATVESLQSDVERIERELRGARLRDRFDQLRRQPPSRSLGRAPLGR